MRAEYIRNESFAEEDTSRDDDNRFRERLRLRAGAEYDATPSLTAGFRLSTGDAAFPPSGWASFSDDFRRDPVSLDRAYVNWRVARSLELRLGAQANPLFAPTELVWDGDVQPAGVVEVLRFGESRLSFTAGQFMLREVRSGRPDNEASSFLLAQGLSWERPRPASRLTLGLSLYAYTDPDAIGRATQTGELSGEFRTNRFDPGGRRIPDPANPGRSVPVDLFSAYRTLGLDARFERTSPPLSVWGGLAVNLGARSDASLGPGFDEKHALALGVFARWGRQQERGDWSLALGLYRIEADATIAAYNSDDLQQSNVQGFSLDAQVRLGGAARLVWDSYVQRKVSTELASAGGIVIPDDATKLRTRLSLLVSF